ncbi:hypothetical protein PGH07_09510 [Sulfurovum sp. zt1-1]|uniref:DUF58 domain-containing protein n=1 Tax=Sulfurovum zhangzhouensis TaxID=3019067 RepID=A0ABT7QZZ4_9BACT|nr:hypothetical protein [Sulfurovum zhangzhouensis]MDM5272415.1 hypothetical protein [Sulfurovum zhangzhouensis]
MLSLRTLNQTRKRLKQKATLGSLIVVLMLFGLFLEAYMHNFNLVYIVLFFVFALAFVASPFGIYNMSGLTLTFQSSDRLFAKETSNIYLALTNNKSAESFALKLKCMDQGLLIPSLKAHSKEVFTLSLSPDKRGKLNIGNCLLQSLFPLATIRFLLPLKLAVSKVVYPRPKGTSLEAFLSRQKGRYGQESDFEGITPYTSNAPLSKIHWPSVAKGESALKKFAYEIPLEQLNFDFFAAGENDESRLSQLTLWILECEAQNLEFQVQMPQENLNSKRMSIDEILEKLALY